MSTLTVTEDVGLSSLTVVKYPKVIDVVNIVVGRCMECDFVVGLGSSEVAGGKVEIEEDG